MTLIITAVAHDKLVQASDRRLTTPDGRLYTDKANKAICVRCADAIFCIAYTGLASIGGQPTTQRLLERLISMNAHRLSIDRLTTELTLQLTARFNRIFCTYKETSFVLAGFTGTPMMAFSALVSNFERPRKFPHGNAQDFINYVRLLKKPGYLFRVNGVQDAVRGAIWRDLQSLGRSRVFLKSNGEQIADRLVAFIRRAADNKSYGRFIGKECMTVWHNPGQDDDFHARYHPRTAGPVGYAPHFLMPPGVAIKNIEYGWCS